MRILASCLVFIVLSTFLYSQDNWEEFRNQAENYYHYIHREEVKNFTCKISSTFYIDFIEEKADSAYYYPLKFIWTRDSGRYYALQPLPEQLSDSLRKATLARIQELKNFFDGILLDWEKFAIQSPLADIPSDAKVQFGEDTVGVKFNLHENNSQILIHETFSRGGQLARVIWNFGEQKVINYPEYREAGEKWLCTGWTNQVYKNDEVTSGVVVQIEYVRIENNYLPIQFNVLAQSQEKPERKVITSLYIKDFVLNEALEVLSDDKPQTSPSPPPE